MPLAGPSSFRSLMIAEAEYGCDEAQSFYLGRPLPPRRDTSPPGTHASAEQIVLVNNAETTYGSALALGRRSSM